MHTRERFFYSPWTVKVSSSNWGWNFPIHRSHVSLHQLTICAHQCTVVAASVLYIGMIILTLTNSGQPLGEVKVTTLDVDYKAEMHGLSVVLSDGKGAFISAKSARYEPQVHVHARVCTCAMCIVQSGGCTM